MFGGRSVVMVLDSDDRFVTACAREMATRGWRVRGARSVDDGLRDAREHALGLAIVDVRVQGESGLELIAPLRVMQPVCKIVVASAYLSVAIAAAALQRGADRVLFKPIHPAEILAQFARVDSKPPPCETPTLARAEWEHINRVLVDCNGNVSEAARRLGILRQSLQRRLRKHAPMQ